MVHIKYKGRTGNQMFQYAFARLIAKHNHLKLETPWANPDFVEATEPPVGDEVLGNMERIDERRYTDNDLNKYHQKSVLIDGYYQTAQFYNPHRQEIHGFWKFPEVEKNTEDLVMHLRLTDYWWDKNISVIHPNWYRNILQKEKFRKLYIVVEPHLTNDRYLHHFDGFAPLYVSKSPREDFDFIRSFDKIICSNSSFCWWAAFLSHAKHVYTFPMWMFNKGIRLADMVGATPMSGTFIGDKKLEAIDWTNYWEKPNEYFRR